MTAAGTILLPNTYLNIRLLMETKCGVTLVPVKAIQHGDDGTFVYVIKPDHTVTIRRVTPGIVAIEGDVMEIKEGLSPGETLVLDAPAGLREGSQIR
jgi:membrane fusion protein, multidrug efflux system